MDGSTGKDLFRKLLKKYPGNWQVKRVLCGDIKLIEAAHHLEMFRLIEFDQGSRGLSDVVLPRTCEMFKVAAAGVLTHLCAAL